MVNIGQRARFGDGGKIACADDLRRRRTDEKALREQCPHRRQRIISRPGSEQTSPHTLQHVAERVNERGWRVAVEPRHHGMRPLNLWQVGADRGENGVTTAHFLSPRFFLYHWWNVSAGACGTSRCLPQALRPL